MLFAVCRPLAMTDAAPVDPIVQPFRVMLFHLLLLYQPDCCNLKNVPKTKAIEIQMKINKIITFQIPTNSTHFSIFVCDSIGVGR